MSHFLSFNPDKRPLPWRRYSREVSSESAIGRVNSFFALRNSL